MGIYYCRSTVAVCNAGLVSGSGRRVTERAFLVKFSRVQFITLRRQESFRAARMRSCLCLILFRVSFYFAARELRQFVSLFFLYRVYFYKSIMHLITYTAYLTLNYC